LSNDIKEKDTRYDIGCLEGIFGQQYINLITDRLEGSNMRKKVVSCKHLTGDNYSFECKITTNSHIVNIPQGMSNAQLIILLMGEARKLAEKWK